MNAAALQAGCSPAGWAWLQAAVARVTADPSAIRGLFPAVGRNVGRGPLDEGTARPGDLFGWTRDDAGRAVLLDALGDRVGEELEGLYRHGDTVERRGVLRWIGRRSDGPASPGALSLVEDALRSNDPRLVAAALGPWAVRHLDAHTLRHAVLKCVFMGIPLGGLVGLDQRADAELAGMLAAYVEERRAAGRDVPDDVWPLIARYRPDAAPRQYR